MSSYVTHLGDDSGGFDIDSLLKAAENAAETVVEKAEAAVSGAASGIVDSGVRSASTAVENLFNGSPQSGSNYSSGPQAPETPVVSAPRSTAGGLSVTDKALGFVKTHGPAIAVAGGVYLWQKSILWSLGAGVAAHLITKKMQKGGSR